MTFSDIRSKILNAAKDESGAVTVDWVVLTAAVVILSIGAISALDTGITGLVGDITGALDGGTTELDGATWATGEEGGT